VLGASLVVLLLSAIGAAAVVGLITFTLLFLLLVPVLLMLLVVALVLGRGRFNVYVVRRFRMPQRGTRRPPGPDRNT
jgi:hypothetical protein